MSEKWISDERAQEIKRRHDRMLIEYVASLDERGVVIIEDGLGLITDISLLLENSGSQGWCALPYKLSSSSHREGCPNRGSQYRSLAGFQDEVVSRVIRECPPTAYTAKRIFDLEQPVFVLFNEFRVGEYAEKMRISSNKLTTPGGWYNVRYWQNVARKEIYERCDRFLREFPGSIVDLCPEAHGVDLTKVMINLGISLNFGEWPPEHNLENVRYQVCLGGYPKDYNELVSSGLLGRES